MATSYGARVLLNSSNQSAALKSLINSGTVGLHLASKDLMQLQQKPEGVLCGASCHNRQELEYAAKFGLDFVVLSPVQVTQSHAETEPLGWDKFSSLIVGYPLPVFALGGMQISNLHQARLLGAHGIAMLRSAWC
jgi:8-oxo-dGTP diphosphatase